MVAFISDNVMDNGLQYLTDNGLRIDVCSQQPTNYTEATSTYSLGNRTAITVSAPQNGNIFTLDAISITIPDIT